MGGQGQNALNLRGKCARITIVYKKETEMFPTEEKYNVGIVEKSVHSTKPPAFVGNIMLLITAMIWGSAFVAQSMGMDYVEPFTYNTVRSFVGALVLIPVIPVFRAMRKKRGEKPYNTKATLLGGVCCGLALFAASSLQQIGISMTTAGKAGFITALYIILVPILGFFLKKKTPKKIWLCAAVAIVGFYLLCIKSDFTLSKGDFYVLLCAVVFSVHILVIDYFIGKNTDGVMMSCVQFFVVGILSIPAMFIFETPTLENIFEARYAILYAGVLSSGVAYTLQIIGQRYTSSTVATLIMSLESVFAALSGWLVLHEQMSLKEFIGCVLVFAAVIFAQLPSREDIKKEKSQ